jgi:hypothetical protein
MTGGIDHRVSVEIAGPMIEWSWVGDDDGTEVSGRGWARREIDKIVGQILVFGGDDFAFQAVLVKTRRTGRSR